MKKIIVVCLMLLCISGIAQDKGVIFQNLSLSEAIAKAKENKNGPKMIFIDCYTSWCGPCKHVASKIFTTDLCGEYLNSTFICLKIDMEKGEGPQIGKKFKVFGYPTFLILDAEGKEINRTSGSSPTAEEFVGKIKEIVDPAKTPGKLLADYEKSKDVGTFLRYMDAMFLARNYEELHNVLSKAFFDLPDSVKFSNKMWKALRNGHFNDASSPVFKYLEKNRQVAERYQPKNTVAGQILRGYCSLLSKYISGKVNLEQAEAERCVSSTLYLSDSSMLASKLATMARYRQASDVDGILSILVSKQALVFSDIFSKMNREDVDVIENAVLAIKDLTVPQKEVIAKYFENKSVVLKGEYDRAQYLKKEYSSASSPASAQ